MQNMNSHFSGESGDGHLGDQLYKTEELPVPVKAIRDYLPVEICSKSIGIGRDHYCCCLYLDTKCGQWRTAQRDALDMNPKMEPVSTILKYRLRVPAQFRLPSVLQADLEKCDAPQSSTSRSRFSIERFHNQQPSALIKSIVQFAGRL